MKTFSKIVFLILISFSLVILNSCEKDEGDKVQKDLIGTWTVDNSSADVTVGGVSLQSYLMSSMQLTEEEAMFLEAMFSDDFGAGPTGTVSIKDDNTYQLNMDGEVENGTWSVSSDGKTLTFTYIVAGGGESSDNLTIISLSSSMLVISLAESEDVDIDGDEINETTLDISMEITLSK